MFCRCVLYYHYPKMLSKKNVLFYFEMWVSRFMSLAVPSRVSCYNMFPDYLSCSPLPPRVYPQSASALVLSRRHFAPLDIFKTVNFAFVCFPFPLEWDLLGRVTAIVNLFSLLPFLLPSEGEITMWWKFSKSKGLFFIAVYLPSFRSAFYLVSSYSFGFFLQQEWLLVLKAVFVFTVPERFGLIK